MDAPSREIACPNCGGPIQFRMGQSQACVCPFCRHSVMRQGVALADLGKVAELAPTAPPMNVGDEGKIDGRRFIVGGRIQLDHGRGPWDELYVEFPDERKWAWVAKSQFGYAYTEPTAASGLPAYQQMTAGAQGALPGSEVAWRVEEQGQSTVVSAEGELPEPARSGERGYYVDLSGPNGEFATIDYGDGSGAPQLFVGRQFAPNEVEVTRRAMGQTPVTEGEGKRKRCPQCGAPIDLHFPQTAERVVCDHCHAGLDVAGPELRYVHQVEQEKRRYDIPLGTEGTLLGEPMIVVGAMTRNTSDEWDTYRWSEYLLHAPSGYVWLLEDSGHFSIGRSVPAGAVLPDGNNHRFAERSYRPFNTGNATVEHVIGEFPWKVRVGDVSTTFDAIHPPYILSREDEQNETNWSHAEHIEGADVWTGLGLPGNPPPKSGVGPAQPNPHSIGKMGLFAGLFIGLLAILGMVTPSDASVPLGDQTVAIQPRGGTRVTIPYNIPSRGGLELRFDGTVTNQWVGISGQVVPAEGGPIPFTLYFADYESQGRRWGNPRTRVRVPGVPAGPARVVLDLQTVDYPHLGMTSRAPQLRVRADTIGKSTHCGCCAFVLIILPLGFVLMRHSAFESRRRSGGNLT